MLSQDVFLCIAHALMKWCCSDTLRFLLRALGLFAPALAKLAATVVGDAYAVFLVILLKCLRLKQSLRRSCQSARPYESLANRHCNTISQERVLNFTDSSSFADSSRRKLCKVMIREACVLTMRLSATADA